MLGLARYRMWVMVRSLVSPLPKDNPVVFLNTRLRKCDARFSTRSVAGEYDNNIRPRQFGRRRAYRGQLTSKMIRMQFETRNHRPSGR